MRRISVRGLVLHQHKLLCVRLKPYHNKIRVDDDYWCTPGGGLDDGESLLDGVRREMVEETGVEPVVGNLLFVQQFAHGEKEFLEFFFHVTNAEDYLQVDLTKTTHGMEEIEEIDFVNPANVRVLPDFLTSEAVAEAIASGTTRVMNRF